MEVTEEIDQVRVLVGAMGVVALILMSAIAYYYIREIRRGASRVLWWDFLFGISYSVLIFYVTLDVCQRIGLELTWRLPIVAAALFIGWPSMVLKLVSLRRADIDRKEKEKP